MLSLLPGILPSLISVFTVHSTFPSKFCCILIWPLSQSTGLYQISLTHQWPIPDPPSMCLCCVHAWSASFIALLVKECAFSLLSFCMPISVMPAASYELLWVRRLSNSHLDKHSSCRNEGYGHLDHVKRPNKKVTLVATVKLKHSHKTWGLKKRWAQT